MEGDLLNPPDTPEVRELKKRSWPTGTACLLWNCTLLPRKYTRLSKMFVGRLCGGWVVCDQDGASLSGVGIGHLAMAGRRDYRRGCQKRRGESWERQSTESQGRCLNRIWLSEGVTSTDVRRMVLNWSVSALKWSNSPRSRRFSLSKQAALLAISSSFCLLLSLLLLAASLFFRRLSQYASSFTSSFSSLITCL